MNSILIYVFSNTTINAPKVTTKNESDDNETIETIAPHTLQSQSVNYGCNKEDIQQVRSNNSFTSIHIDWAFCHDLDFGKFSRCFTKIFTFSKRTRSISSRNIR